jgi:hypothetical protein
MKAAPAPHPGPPAQESFDDVLGMGLERGNAMSAPTSTSRSSQKQQVPLDIRNAGDDFDMEIERGGALVTQGHATSSRGRPHVSDRPGGSADLAPRSGLEVAYQRSDARPIDEQHGPSFGEKLAAWALPIVLCLGAAGSLFKFVHRKGGRNLMALAPHAFDATSTMQSGGFALTALALAIVLVFGGLKLRPRSYATVGSAAMLLVAALAMVTVTLVSTDEHPTPADGALLIPYVVPLGTILLGVGVAGRGPALFLDGGARRAGTVVAGLLGGTLIFVGIEISAFASRLP